MADRDRRDDVLEEIRDELRLNREERREAAAQAERHAAQAERHAAQAERHAAMFEDTREFIREQTVRVDRAFRELSLEIRGLAAEVRASGEFTRRAIVEAITEIRERREESHAQTQALLRLIDRMDRFDPGGSSAAA